MATSIIKDSQYGKIVFQNFDYTIPKISANTATQVSVPASKAGYTLLGAVSFNVEYNRCSIYRMSPSSQNMVFQIQNFSNEVTNIGLHFTAVYVR